MANNLLDKASIILTPTAYNNGEALCVKPSDGSGDFDFSRNSAATRVNAQGLVENVQILSSNLVQNGDFSEEGSEEVSNGSFSQQGSELITNGDFSSDTAWVKGTGTTISGGSANFVNADGVSLYQSIGTQSGFVKITFNVTDYTSGTLNVYSGGNQSVGSINVSANALGTYTAYVDRNGGNVNIIFGSSDNFTGSIDNVSVREVGQNWSLGTGVSIGENKAVFTSTPSGQSVSQNAVASQIPNGTSVKVSFEVLSISSGSFGVYFSGSLVGSLNSVGVATFYFEKGTETSFYIRALGTTTGSITNISVKEVGQNWDLLNGTITDKYNASLTSYQNGIRVNPFTYTGTVKVTFDLVVTSGSCKFVAGGSNEQIYSTSGTKEIIVTNPSRFEFNAFNLGWVGTLDNVSAIQITDDTNLPRINYEGFSYQDALGSELVLNGTFDSDTAWTKGSGWAIANGVATHTGGASYLSQSILNADTQYKVNISVTAVSGGGFVQIYMGNSPASVTISTIGDYTYYFTSQSLQTLGFALRSLGDVTIDNVSVKEYSGQEVVPDSGCGSWLFEPQSTNVITQSETFSDASWVNNGITITSNEITSPSGTLNADLLTGVSGGFGVVKFSTWTATNKVASCFAKKGSTNLFKIANVSGGIGGVTFNLENGTVTNEDSGFESNIENYGNGWYRCTAIDTLGRTGTFSLGVTAASESVYIWGAMLEQNSFSTSYIPTSGSTVTRNQDLCTNGGSLASINSTEGVLYAEFKVFDSDNSYKMIEINDGSSSNNRVVLYVYGSNIFGFIKSNGNTNLNVFSAETVTNFNKVAIKWGSVDTALWVNGVEINTGTASTFTQNILSVLSFLGSGTQYFFGKTKALAVFPYLTDQELTELTTI